MLYFLCICRLLSEVYVWLLLFSFERYFFLLITTENISLSIEIILFFSNCPLDRTVLHHMNVSCTFRFFYFPQKESSFSIHSCVRVRINQRRIQEIFQQISVSFKHLRGVLRNNEHQIHGNSCSEGSIFRCLNFFHKFSYQSKIKFKFAKAYFGTMACMMIVVMAWCPCSSATLFPDAQIFVKQPVWISLFARPSKSLPIVCTIT